MAIHDKYAALAKRLIRKNGGPVVLYKNSRTATNPAKPWEGNTNVFAQTYDMIGLLTEYTEEEIDGVNILRGDRRVLVESSNDLKGFNAVSIGTEFFSIVRVNVLRPGTTTIMYDIQVRA